jgi:ech hydrogenase subunit D
MLLNERQVTHDELLTRVEEMKEQGYRFVTATCVQSGDTMELIYHFDRELTLVHLRLTTQRDAPFTAFRPSTVALIS